jgi:hypothetical protein
MYTVAVQLCGFPVTRAGRYQVSIAVGDQPAESVGVLITQAESPAGTE